MDQDQFKMRRQQRADFLRALYQQVDGSVNEFVDGLVLGSELGVDTAEARRIIAYLEEKGFVKVDDHKSGVIRITAVGIDEVEAEIA